ncbi:MAG: hypothetical protein R3C20_18710 [Planctomycetaceae bacterium]
MQKSSAKDVIGMPGGGLVEIRWVFVHDLTGTHRNDYFFTTDRSLRASEIIGIFTGCWSIETMFQEMRAYLWLETTRGRTRSTVLRAAPMLFALYSVVVLLYSQLPSRWKSLEGIRWEGKSTVTFSEVITRVRCWLWSEWVFETLGKHHAFSKLPHRFRDTILHALAAVV